MSLLRKILGKKTVVSAVIPVAKNENPDLAVLKSILASMDKAEQKRFESVESALFKARAFGIAGLTVSSINAIGIIVLLCL